MPALIGSLEFSWGWSVGEAVVGRNLYYALALPLGKMSLHARLAGMSLAKLSLDDKGMPTDNAMSKKLLMCALPAHAQLSPSFLLRQHIDPFNLKHGLNSLNFVQAVSTELQEHGESDILISFALHHCSLFNAMAVQNFSNFALLKSFNYVLDLKVALQTCALFGNTRLKRITNLNQVAKDLGYSKDLTNQINRVEALHYVYQYLLSHDPKIMAFLTLSRQQRLNLTKGPYFVHLDDQGLGIIKLLAQSPEGHLLKALKCNGKELTVITINLDLAPLVAPLGILTAERQQTLHFDVASIIARLDSVKFSDLLSCKDLERLIAEVSTEDSVDDDASLGLEERCYAHLCAFSEQDMSVDERFVSELSDKERQVWESLASHEAPNQDYATLVEQTSPKFASMVLCYLNENFASQCFAPEHERYVQYCRALQERCVPIYLKECQMLYQSLPESDVKGMALLGRIASYY